MAGASPFHLAVPGRKSDVSDCQWLQYLHLVGLLRGHSGRNKRSARALDPPSSGMVWCRWRRVMSDTYKRALDQMNLQLHHVISDITGVTGLAIIEAILAGERNRQTLVKLRNGRIKATDYRREHLFELGQSLAGVPSLPRIDRCVRQRDRAVSRDIRIESGSPGRS